MTSRVYVQQPDLLSILLRSGPRVEGLATVYNRATQHTFGARPRPNPMLLIRGHIRPFDSRHNEATGLAAQCGQ